MALVDLLELAKDLPPDRALAGLDHGETTIGVAISDVRLTVASPATLIRKTKFTRDADALFSLMSERGASAIVLGLPINMDGTEGRRCQSVRAFARNLLRLRDMPIALWDERLSTAGVTRVLISEADASRARRAQSVDKMAAAWILQGALDRLRAAGANPRVPL